VVPLSTSTSGAESTAARRVGASYWSFPYAHAVLAMSCGLPSFTRNEARVSIHKAGALWSSVEAAHAVFEMACGEPSFTRNEERVSISLNRAGAL